MNVVMIYPAYTFPICRLLNTITSYKQLVFQAGPAWSRPEPKCDLPCARIYVVSLFLPHPSQCKAGRTCFSWEGVVECDLP